MTTTKSINHRGRKPLAKCEECGEGIFKYQTYRCYECGKVLCGNHAHYHVDEDSGRITENALPQCEECYNKRYYPDKKTDYSDFIEKIIICLDTEKLSKAEAFDSLCVYIEREEAIKVILDYAKNA